MKNTVKAWGGALLLCFAAIGCGQDQISAEFDPAGEEAQQAYFVQKSVAQEFPADAEGDQTIDVVLYRQNAEGTLAVELTAKSASRFFEVPPTVTFDQGAYSVTVPVKVKGIENFAKGANYSVTISVPEVEDPAGTASIADKFSSVTVTTTLTLLWQPCYILKDPSKLLSDDLTAADYVVGPDGKPMVQTATYTYAFWWEGEDDTITLERAQGTNVFRMTNWGGGVDLIFQILPDVQVGGYAVCKTDSQEVGATYDDGTPGMVADPVSLGYPAGATYEKYPSVWNGQREFRFTLQYYLADGRAFNALAQETLTLHTGQSDL